MVLEFWITVERHIVEKNRQPAAEAATVSIVQQSPAGASAPSGLAQFEEAHAGTADTEDD